MRWRDGRPMAIRAQGRFLLASCAVQFVASSTVSIREGVPAQVERASNGGKLTPAQRGDVDKYNDLLNQYLGARCHV